MLCNMHFLMVWFGILENGFLHRIAAKTACLSHPFSKASETTSTFFPELNNLACREQCFFAAHGKCAARPSDVLFKAA